MPKIVHFSLLVYLFYSCTPPQETEKKYLFLGHPYDWGDETKIDERLERLDWSAYEQIWLGGDVCSQTTKELSTYETISLFFLFSVYTYETRMMMCFF